MVPADCTFGPADVQLYFPQVESQLAVQSLKPRIDMIKARYAEDKDKISSETSVLYEAAGVNPLAGGSRFEMRAGVRQVG